MYTQIPVCSDGFVLNLIALLLLFCKPFTAKFTEYPVQFSKVNCFYFLDDTYIRNGSKIEKLDSDAVAAFRLSHSKYEVALTEVTIEPIYKSSLDQGEGPAWEVPAPNFVTECFFLSHLAISLISKKLEQ